MTDDSPIAPGRKCGTCTLCCKVMKIDELEKPRGIWCRHCSVGVGCRIYDDRPGECRRFLCGYLTEASLSEDWLPTKSKIVLAADLDGKRIAAHVDPSRPDAWKAEPFYSQLKEWARLAAPVNGQVLACVGRTTVVILPDKDVDLGVVADNELIVTLERVTPLGITVDALKIRNDDPRAAALVNRK
jgi:hypothetical protein